MKLYKNRYICTKKTEYQAKYSKIYEKISK